MPKVIRQAIIQMETDMEQCEFEDWLLNLIKCVAIDPEKSDIIRLSNCNFSEDKFVEFFNKHSNNTDMRTAPNKPPVKASKWEY